MATINPANLAEDFTSLFPGAGGALLKGSGLADRLANDIAGQQAAVRPNPVPTRGIDGPPAVNPGIQNTPAPSPQLNSNPPVPSTPAAQEPIQQAQAAVGGFPQLFSPAAGSLVSGSGLLSELRKRLKPQNRTF